MSTTKTTAEAERTGREDESSRTVVFGPDHNGMRIHASEVLIGNNEDTSRFRSMMLGRLRGLARRYYSGDTGAVDEFLQLYSLGVNARKAAKERQGLAEPVGGAS